MNYDPITSSFNDLMGDECPYASLSFQNASPVTKQVHNHATEFDTHTVLLYTFKLKGDKTGFK